MKVEDMSNYYFNLKKIRKQNGLTQDSLAKLLNMTQQNISEYENQLVSPNLDRIFEIALVLDVTLDDLVFIKKIYSDNKINKLGVEYEKE